jgi:anti-anti-sigma factor
MDSLLSFYEHHGMRVVPLAGEFDRCNSERLREFIAAANDGSRPVVIDLSEATYIDTSILSILILAKNLLGSQLCLIVPERANLRRLFEVTGLDVVLGTKRSLEDARLALTCQCGRPNAVGRAG